MKNIRKFWEERSKKYGNRIEGVLPKSFPKFVNYYLDQWMYAQVRSGIKVGNPKVLDLGCGYGRLSGQILNEFPKARTFGIDISQTYVELYNQSLLPRGKAVRGDLRKLPFKNSFFDLVIMVTALMYVRQYNEQARALKELFRVLKPGGHFVIIERSASGYSIIMLGGLVEKLRGPKKREIPAVSFSPQHMVNLIDKSGGVLKMIKGVPALLTISLYIAYSGVREE